MKKITPADVVKNTCWENRADVLEIFAGRKTMTALDALTDARLCDSDAIDAVLKTEAVTDAQMAEFVRLCSERVQRVLLGPPSVAAHEAVCEAQLAAIKKAGDAARAAGESATEHEVIVRTATLARDASAAERQKQRAQLLALARSE